MLRFPVVLTIVLGLASTAVAAETIAGYQKSSDNEGGISVNDVFDLNPKNNALRHRVERDCESGKWDSCILIADVYKSRWNLDKYFSLLEKTCNKGYAPGCVRLALNYDRGLNTQSDLKKANEYHKKACKYGDASECYIIGKRHMSAYGTTLDFGKANEFFLSACNKGHGAGCLNIGNAYFNGYDIRQDYRKANEFFHKACLKGISEGCFNLGISYAEGKGVRQNFSEAKEFFGKACDLGDQKGCDEYARLNSGRR